ncbi:hypothetical protein [uncultured Flavobacterium sp.]|uniref:hypothetical protein n=1 Tax=uncultured Flavobacterium sp. TaxID=165435 RepID=UPI0030EEC99C
MTTFATMIAISHKAKQFFLVTIKLLIVSGAIYYVYWHFSGDKKIDFNQIKGYLDLKVLLILTAFSSMNWILEIFKWRHLVSSFKEISFFEAMEQSLGSLTASIFTPNRIGEYGAKALYFPKENTKQIVLLNFIGNSSQMFITTLFGLIGILITDFKFEIFDWILAFTVIVIIFSPLLYFARNIEIYGFSIRTIISYSSDFHINNLWFSAIRYLVFSFQFMFLLSVFLIKMDFATAMGTIFTMYFLASIIPSIHFMDVAIKGSVALFLFGQLNVEDWKIAAIISIMWIFNLVLPLLVGSVFVLNYKPLRK